jgi:UPF0755 protein
MRLKKFIKVSVTPSISVKDISTYLFKNVNLLIALSGILICYLLIKILIAGFHREENIRLHIAEGDNLKTVAEKIKSEVPEFNKLTFRVLGRLFKYDRKILPGLYLLKPGFTYLDILNQITNPLVAQTVLITVPEGLTIKQIARLLKKRLGIDSARFVSETENDSLIKSLGIRAENLEGFLFPDTYDFKLNKTNPEAEIVRVLFNGFRKKVLPEIKKKPDADIMKVITLASIIEAETRYDPEKKTISGVYHNRLRKGMKLEADPTVLYALPEPKKRLLYSDLKYNSPYNTYLNKGLPPGPINNPGLQSVIAALYPEKHNYFYFVARGDGSHRFAENYQDHLKNVELYRSYLNEKKYMQEK